MRLILLVALARLQWRLGSAEAERAQLCDRWATEAQLRAAARFDAAARLLDRARLAR